MSYRFNPFTGKLDLVGSGGTPGGLNTQVQYNNAGAFGGITGVVSDGSSLQLNDDVALKLGTTPYATLKVDATTIPGEKFIYLNENAAGSDTYFFNINRTSTRTTDIVVGLNANLTATPSGASSANYYALFFGASNTGSANNITGTMYGIGGSTTVAEAGRSTTKAVGVLGNIDLQAGSAGAIAALEAQISLSGGTATTAYGLNVLNIAGAGLTTAYGVRINSISGGGTNWGLAVGNNNSYFEGNTRFGSTGAPTDRLTITGGGITWDGGTAVTAGAYQIIRDADATNQLHFNVPTGAGMEWSINDVRFMKSFASGHVEIGNQVGLDTSTLWVAETVGNTSAQAIRGRLDVANTILVNSSYYGLFFPLTNQGSLGTINGEFYGVYGQAVNTEAQTIANAAGVAGLFSANAGTTTLGVGVKGMVLANGGNATTTIGVYAPAFTNNGGSTFTNSYGLKVDPPGVGTNQYTAAFGSGFSYFDTNARLHVGSSTDDATTTLKATGATSTSGTGKTTFKVVAPAHSGLDSVAFNDVYFDLSRTVTFLGDGGGSPLDIFSFYIDAPTYEASDAQQDFNVACTVVISGPPVASTNVSITTPIALGVASGNTLFGGGLMQTGHTIQGSGWSIGAGSTLSTNDVYYIKETFTAGSGTQVGLRSEVTSNPTANGTSLVSLAFQAATAAASNDNFSIIAGVQGSAKHEGSGTVTTVVGGVFEGIQNGSAAVTELYGSIHRMSLTSTGNVTGAYHLYIPSFTDTGAGSITGDLVAIYVDPVTAGTNDWLLYYNNGASGVFWDGSGRLGLGTSSSLADKITIAASGIRWSSGAAATASAYQIIRNNDATNQFQFNVPTGAGFEWSVNDVARMTLSANGNLALSQAVITSGSPTALTVTTGAHTTLANSYFRNVFFDLTDNIQFTGGGGSFFSIGMEVDLRSTVSAAAAQSFDALVGVNFYGMPKLGTNASGPVAAVLIQGPLDGTSSTLNTALAIDPVGLDSGIGAVTTAASLYLAAFSNRSLGNQTATLTNLNSIRVEAVTYDSTTNVRTVTNPATMYIGGAPVASTNVTFTNLAKALHVASGLTVLEGGVSTKLSNANVSNPPTDAELDSAFGDPTTLPPGFIGIVDDNGAGTDVWLCVTTGVAGEWFYEALTKAV